MIDNIIRFSLCHRITIIVGVILIVISGIFTSLKMDIDVFPDLTAPTVVIMSDCHGMTSEEVERLVTYPIETAVNGATNVRRVRSSSAYGSSFVWVEFDWGMDISRARQIVSEKMVSLTGELPHNIIPRLAPQSSVMGEILYVALQTNTKNNKQQPATSMMELRSIADWIIKPAILATGGVSQVTIIGGDYKQYKILCHPQLMNAYNVTMEELYDAAGNMSVNTEGGIIREYGNEYALRGIGRTNSIEQLAAVLVKNNPSGTPITIGDVADITVGSAVKMGNGSMNNQPAVILSVSKQPNVNTLAVTEKIEANLDEIRHSLPDDVEMNTHVFRQADFIKASVNNVSKALLQGACLVILILFLFLGSFRTTIISVTAIPLSLLGTLTILHFIGMEINTMTLGGMCIAIGSLVDDAIIDVENVYKRLRQNHILPPASRQSTVKIVFEASREIRSSILNATFIVMVAFIPMFFLTGMEGRMLKPLGISYIIALFMSLIVAMTVTPLFCQFILTNSQYLDKQGKDNLITSALNRWYTRNLSRAFNHSHNILCATIIILILSIITFFTFGSAFLPDFNEGSLTINAACSPGISLQESDAIGNIIEQRLHQIPEVTTTTRRTGRGELDEHSQSTNSSEIDVNFIAGKRTKSDIVAHVRHQLASIPGIATTIGQPLSHRIDHILSGTQANIALKLFGSDLNQMLQTCGYIKASISDIPGLVDVNIDQVTSTPQLIVRPNMQALAQHGISMKTFNNHITMSFSSIKIGDIYEGQRAYDLILRLDSNYTESIDGVRRSLIDTGNGKKIPLEDVAEIISTSGPNKITRENVQRKLVISANVAGRDVGSVIKDIKRAINTHITLPQGYRLEYGGQYESARRASITLWTASLLAIIVIFLLLYGEFHSFSLSCVILSSLPLSLIGGVLAVLLTSRTASIPVIIGFITLFGIATRNSILLISRYQRLLEKYPEQPLLTTLTVGAVDRLNPILMTALTSALALIPLIINSTRPGNEIQSPMAVVVLGGLLTSTMLNLFVIPLIYQRYINHQHKNHIKKTL